jgi:glycosyltransferase involved in cell wall biosynthesis
MTHILLLPSWYPVHPNDVAGVFFRDQALALSARGHKVGVVAPMMHSVKKLLFSKRLQRGVRRENDNGVFTYRKDFWAAMPRIPYGNYLLWRRAADQLLEQYIDEQGMPDILHTHCAIFAGAVAARWKRWFGLPVVLTEHSSVFARGILRPWQLRLAKKAAATADLRIAVSPALGGILSTMLSSNSNDWNWIPNIVAERFQQEVRQVPGRNNKIRFLNLALMAEKKGQSYLLDAFARAFPDGENCELVFAGDGPIEEQLAEKARQLGISSRVHFLGRIPPADVPNLLRSVDVMVVSSHYETFGLAAAEALMCGTPVVATRCGGPECIVEDGDGLLVPPKDPHALSKALVRIADILPHMNSKDIALRARQRFSPEAVGKQLEAVYDELMSAKGKAGPRE